MRTKSQLNCARRQRSTLRRSGRALPAQTRQFGQRPRATNDRTSAIMHHKRRNHGRCLGAPLTRRIYMQRPRTQSVAPMARTARDDLRRRSRGLADGGRGTGTEQRSTRHRRGRRPRDPPGRAISGRARPHARSAGGPAASTAPAGPAAERLARGRRREPRRGQRGPAVGPGAANLQGMLTGEAPPSSLR